MTLLRGLGVEELSKPELTGEWEYKLAQIEHGELRRKELMRQIAQMTHHIVRKAKEDDHDTVPGDYTTLKTPCPNCGGVVNQNYRRYTCTGKDGKGDGCGFSFGKNPGGRTFETSEVEQLLTEKQIGPLEGFRSKGGWPFTATIILKFNEEEKNWKLEFDFGNDDQDTGELVDFSIKSCSARARNAAVAYSRRPVSVRERGPHREPDRSDLRFQEPKGDPAAADRAAQMMKLLATGKTDQLEKFISNRTRRPFKAFLVWDKESGKVNFEFAPSKFPSRRPSAAARRRREAAASGPAPARKVSVSAGRASRRKTALPRPRGNRRAKQ